jgi:hypothetical protein
VFFLATVMPAQSAAGRAYENAWGTPDRHLVYSPDEFYTAVATWGAAGRQDYIDFRLGLDIVWAFAYTAFLVFAIGCAARVAFGRGDRRRLLNLAPLPTIVLDYAENATGIFLVGAFPVRHDATAWLATAMTAGKWLTLVAAHGVLAYAVVMAVRARRGRSRGQ